jgi:hypothetical protein
MDSDEMLEVIDKEMMQKEKLIDILCNRWQGNTVQLCRELLTAIIKDDGGVSSIPSGLRIERSWMPSTKRSGHSAICQERPGN